MGNALAVVQVLPQLFIGTRSATSLSNLRMYSIQAIANVKIAELDKPADDIDYFKDCLGDDAPFPLSRLKRIAEWVDNKIKEGKKVLVNCEVGQERSPLVVMIYLHTYRNMTFPDAYRFVAANHYWLKDFDFYYGWVKWDE